VDLERAAARHGSKRHVEHRVAAVLRGARHASGFLTRTRGLREGVPHVARTTYAGLALSAGTPTPADQRPGGDLSGIRDGELWARRRWRLREAQTRSIGHEGLALEAAREAWLLPTAAARWAGRQSSIRFYVFLTTYKGCTTPPQQLQD